jgi:hypothetical protein
LAGLKRFDWDCIGKMATLNDYLNLFGGDEDRFLFFFFVEPKMMLLDRILPPLAKAEALSDQQRFSDADAMYQALLSEPYLNQYVEKLYVRRRRAENMLAWADL